MFRCGSASNSPEVKKRVHNMLFLLCCFPVKYKRRGLFTLGIILDRLATRYSYAFLSKAEASEKTGLPLPAIHRVSLMYFGFQCMPNRGKKSPKPHRLITYRQWCSAIVNQLNQVNRLIDLSESTLVTSVQM